MADAAHGVAWPATGNTDNRGMTELILIRHGETDWNRELRFQGQVDVPLNAIGHEQARRAGLQLAGETVQHLVCSDLLRTRQSAMPSAQQLGLRAVNDAALREQNFGVVDGMRSGDIESQYPQAWSRWLEFDADFAFDGGESTPGIPCPRHGGTGSPGAAPRWTMPADRDPWRRARHDLSHGAGSALVGPAPRAPFPMAPSIACGCRGSR